MSKTKKPVVKPTAKSSKKKLSPAERSQIAKDRWAKRRGEVAPQDAVQGEIDVRTPSSDDYSHSDNISEPTIISDGDGEPTVGSTVREVHAESIPPTQKKETIFYETPVEKIFRQNPDGSLTEIVGGVDIEVTPVAPPIAPDPAPQLVPVAPKKQKRYTGPKEFSVALKAAENRLAKAITERSDIGKELAILQAKQWYLEKTEIPSLMGIINALKGSGNYAPPVPYDLSGGVPNATAFQSPIPQPQFQSGPDLAAIQAAMDAAQVAPPVSKATGGAMQFSPEVIGNLEGPDEDDNEDKFITGPLAGGGWK